MITPKQSKKHARTNIQWDTIKVIFVPANKQKLNPLNHCSRLSFEERWNRILHLAARIWKA
jgi:hypothetical protein